MKLHTYLYQNGITLTQFARQIGVTHAAVSRYRSMARVPTQAIMRRIMSATAGEVTANDFVSDEGYVSVEMRRYSKGKAK
jgi:transcriptional regulator with XRE-family HTH domain